MEYSRSHIIVVALLPIVISGCWLATFNLSREDILVGQQGFFDHTLHTTTLAYVNCVQCHSSESPKAWTTGEGAPAQINFKQYRKEMCHSCHLDGKYPVKTVSVCSKCHASDFVAERVGVDHRLNGINSHKRMRRYMGYACESCHTAQWCDACHFSRETVMRSAHPANYVALHYVETAANPARCGSCHTETSCNKCHLTNRWP